MDTEKQRYLELADFLKTRRNRITPAMLGLPTSSRRRTPGLKREEVAQLAGISLTWYTWMEQGRSIQVSAQVLENISQVLLLNQQERGHLFTLAKQVIPPEAYQYKGFINPVLQNVLNHIRFCPAMVLDSKWNIIAWNQVACFIFGDMEKRNDLERNLIWAMFLNWEYRNLFVNWEEHAKATLARFRASCGQYMQDPWFLEFSAELQKRSKEFAVWWSLHDVERKGGFQKEICHPIAGRLFFEFSSFDVSDNSELRMIVNTPVTGTGTAEKIERCMLNVI